ncbi:MAG: hypothetical protein ACLP5J_25250 [Mycobacterium sp.]|uniref:hypothetical protein n=1 Tax=Mycobacterium sp. TaxID=1785 RepID=UPI003F9465C9
MTAEGRIIARKIAHAKAQRKAVADTAREFVRRAHAAGATEVELAKLLGVDRANTIRRWLGKDK